MTAAVLEARAALRRYMATGATGQDLLESTEAAVRRAAIIVQTRRPELSKAEVGTIAKRMALTAVALAAFEDADEAADWLGRTGEF